MSIKTSFINFQTPIHYTKELFAGLTVAMTMIPESLSFAILAGLSPLVGLYAAFMMGLITSIFGGRPGMVSGGAGATVVVLIALISSHGVEYLFAAVVLAGLIQAFVGIMKWGKFVRLIPQPVMYGFLNGLAIIIFMAQIGQFKVPDGTGAAWITGSGLYTMLALTLLTILIVVFSPKITKKIPSSLVAIVVTFILVSVIGIETKTVGDIAHISGALPSFSIPLVPLTWETIQVIAPYALVMAGVGLIESLLTLSMVDEITNTKGSANREVIAQGGANIVNGFFGGMGGCAMVAQTLVNLDAGSRSRLAAFIASITILFIILFGGPIIQQIPMAALVGVMMMVAVGTFQWISVRIINKMPKSDIFVGILVAAITVLLNNLALAVLIGVIIAALVFAWESAKRIRARTSVDGQGRKVYEIYGPLFFGSIEAFENKFSWTEDPENIVIDFKDSRVADMSAISSLNKITEKYKNEGKTVFLKHLSTDCRSKLDKAGATILINYDEDPTYRIPE